MTVAALAAELNESVKNGGGHLRVHLSSMLGDDGRTVYPITDAYEAGSNSGELYWLDVGAPIAEKDLKRW